MIDIASGTIGCGISGGLSSMVMGGNFWDGAKIGAITGGAMCALNAYARIDEVFSDPYLTRDIWTGRGTGLKHYNTAINYKFQSATLNTDNLISVPSKMPSELVYSEHAGFPDYKQTTEWGCGQAQLRNYDDVFKISRYDKSLYKEGGISVEELFKKGGYKVKIGGFNIRSIVNNMQSGIYTSLSLKTELPGVGHFVSVDGIRVYKDGTYNIWLVNSLSGLSDDAIVQFNQSNRLEMLRIYYIGR